MGNLVQGVDPNLVRPDYHLGALGSGFFAVLELAVYALVLGIACFAILRWRRRAASAEASFSPEAKLVPGEIVVHGTVEYATGENKAVRVEVDQHGSESESSGSWSTRWTEQRRRVAVRPFYLKHASGQRIRVEPTHEVELVDEMDGVIRVNEAKRVLVAELTEGEGVFAHGVLSQEVDPEAPAGYRGGQYGLVLRPGAGGHLLLSSEPLGERFRRRARLHFRFALSVLVFAVVTNVIMLPYHSRLFAGRVTTGVISDLKHLVIPDSEGADEHRFRVWAKTPELSKHEICDDLDEAVFAKLKIGQGIPVRYSVKGASSAQLGTSATFHFALLFLIYLPLGLLTLIYRHSAAQPQTWYEGEVNETESGRLRDSMTAPPDTKRQS